MAYLIKLLPCLSSCALAQEPESEPLAVEKQVALTQ